MTKAAQAPDPTLPVVLRQLREQRGMPREALAHDAGITVSALTRIELGQANPSWATVRAIAAALDVGIGQLAAAIEAEEASPR